jgi:hypothetical protein
MDEDKPKLVSRVWQWLDTGWDLYVMPAMILGAALFMLSGIFDRVPTLQELKAVESSVVSYHLHQREAGQHRSVADWVKARFTDEATLKAQQSQRDFESSIVIVTLQNGLSFWSPRIEPLNVANTLKVGMTARVYLDVNATDEPEYENAVSVFGLMLDGKELDAPTDVVERHYWSKWLISGGMGVLLLFLAFYYHWDIKRKQAASV